MASSGIVEIQMPQMGESVTEGTVLEWHKREGEFVEEGETVVEVSTDKVDAEVPAPASGTITKILKGEDETIPVGGVLAELDPTAEPSGDGASAEASGEKTADTAAEGGAARASGEAAVAASEPAAPPASQPAGNEAEGEASGGVIQEASGGVVPEASGGVVIQVSMPEMGESVTEGTVLEWHKQEGEFIEEGETLVEVSTDKVDAEVPAPASGTITKILAQPDETVQIGQVLAEMTRRALPKVAPPGLATKSRVARLNLPPRQRPNPPETEPKARLPAEYRRSARGPPHRGGERDRPERRARARVREARSPRQTCWLRPTARARRRRQRSSPCAVPRRCWRRR